ncbi:hypothetical protein E1265_16295 [Streptomyces sp. 8K308]|uniref:hypothetical protein n=1 Tax=Streptomyces sp. 8K308 TaxID=2530388 RepID=UPI00104B3A70|nr:hypothetical protein [Streptomyces sp. 8K308]TDC22176.1 hypothetical protein E1265_16295 [Streptomyces sp. 8K308]
MLGDERLKAALKAADPVRDERLPDPEGPAGPHLLTTARRRAGQSRLRRLVVIPTAVAVTVGTATAAVVLATGEGAVVDSTLVRCMAPEGGYRPIPESDPLPYMSTTFNAATDDLDAICRGLLVEQETWESVVADTPLTPCVNDEGLIVVRPGTTGVCAEYDEVLYVGVTEEQHRIAEFRLAVEESVAFGPDQCFLMADLPALVDRLQAEHGLTGWTVRLSDDVPGTCVANVLFRESEREITAWAVDERTLEEILDEDVPEGEAEPVR